MVASGDLTDDAVRRGFAFADFSGYAGTAAAVRTGVEALAGDEVVVHSPKAEHLRAALLGAPLVGAIVYDTAAFAGSEREAFEVATAAAAGAGTSERAVAFLRDAGLRSAQELPFVSATRCWDVPSDAGLARLLDDGAANCVYAGQLDANAGIDRLLAAFAFLLALEVDARLIMCVPLEPVTDVLRDFRSTVADSGLAGRVLEISSSDPGRLAAAYRAATIFWTLSVTATSLVPLVDAMWFDVPVLAYASAPCAALLGPAGLLVRDAADPGQIAGLAKILIGDAKLRETVLSMQQRRREALTYDRAAGARCARDYLGPAVLERSPA
jgi:glycosyltransferase involved in cell wall biosynthesis